MTEQPHIRILKSTTIIGGSSGVSVVFRVIQAKAAALLLGPTGVGFMGLLNASLALGATISSMGLATSSVRQIAEAVSSGEEEKLARTVATFERVTLFFGIAGALIFFALREFIALLTFGNTARSATVGVMAIALLLTVVSSAEQALIRGMRRVADLARVTVIGAASGTLLGIPLLYVLGMQGVAPYLILISATTALASRWYARKIPIARTHLTWRETLGEAKSQLSLGIVFMITGLVTMATTYIVKVLVTRQLGLGAAGLYEAASTLSNVYVGFILSAMGADFFPHLAAVADDHALSCQLINAQVEVGLLMVTPGILIVIALGPFLLQLLYSTSFSVAFEILRWQALGTLLRVISWPIGFLTLTHGRGSWFFGTELITNAFYLGMLTLGIQLWGLPGIGVAFFVMYIFYVGLMTMVARHLIGFSWSSRNLKLTMLLSPAILTGILASFFLPPILSLIAGLALVIMISVYSLKTLYVLVGPTEAKILRYRLKSLLRRTEDNS